MMQKNGGNYGNGNGNSRTTTASNSLQVFLDLRVMQVMGKRKHWITTFGSIRALTVEPLAIRITCTNPLLVVPNQELSPTPYLSTSLPINHHCPSPLLPPSPPPPPSQASLHPLPTTHLRPRSHSRPLLLRLPLFSTQAKLRTPILIT